VDESDHLALVNTGDEEVVSQEEGEGGGAQREGGGCCLRDRYRTHAGTQGEKNSTRLGRVALTGGPVCVCGH